MHGGERMKAFFQDTGGSFAVIAAVLCPLLVLAAGFTVDVGQIYSAKSNLRAALDSAVTSTARDITTGVIKEEDAEGRVLDFLAANGDLNVSNGNAIVIGDFTIDHTAKTVSAEAYVDVDLFFPVFGLPETQRVATKAAAIYSDKKVEVAMMLDVTRSMEKKGKVDKIGDLKAAARNAVETILKNQDPRNPRIRVALVPYASGVNVGTLAKNLYAETPSSSNLPPVAGSSLLVEKTGSRKLPSYADYLTIVGKAFPRPDSCATERRGSDGKPDLSADGPQTVRTDSTGKEYYALVNRDDHLSGEGLNKCPDAKVIPLTADTKPLLDSIASFEANGYTGGALGIQWTYYMLSHGWAQAISAAGLGDGPAEHNKKKVSKVAILMTDGQFNTAYAGASGSYNSQGTLSRRNAEGLCSRMKAEDIEIYTIGFDLDNRSMSQEERDQAKGVLKNCATRDTSFIKHYFEASTGAELDAAFQEIISNTERLALTQ